MRKSINDSVFLMLEEKLKGREMKKEKRQKSICKISRNMTTNRNQVHFSEDEIL